MATLNITEKETARLKKLALAVIQGGTTKYMRGSDQILVQAIVDEYEKGTISLQWLNGEEEVYTLDGADVVKISVNYGFWRGFKMGVILSVLALLFLFFKCR